MFETFIRIVLCIIAVVGLAFFIAPMSVNVINIGNIAGIALCVWLLMVSFKPLHNAIKTALCHFAFTKFIYYAVNTCFIAFAVLGIAMSALMVYGMNQKPNINTTAVVLGAQVLPSGNPSTILRGRIDAAEQYLKENPKAKAILSGGKGNNEPVSEAQCMYNNLVAKGIDPSRLFIEDKSTDTTENLKFSREILKRESLGNNITIITDGFHQERARIITKQLDFKGDVGAYNAATSMKYAPTYFVREWFGIPYQVLFKKS
ncbi:MAG: YdcF family protein [Ruminococcus sp.]|nr:YdcF family protein [Ruminococcus sp.]